VSDIKALLAEAHRGDEVVVLGGECLGSLVTLDEEGSPDGNPCNGLNAGAFHVALANMVGLRGRGVVLNGTTLTAIVVGFDMAEPLPLSPSEAAERQTDPSSPYSASPDAVGFYWVETTLRLLTEDAAAPSRAPRQAETLLVDWTAGYVLEVDEQGAIVGGEWSRGPRPDLLWVPVDTVEETRGGDQALRRNPNVTMSNVSLLLTPEPVVQEGSPYVRILSPRPGDRAESPVSFRFETSPDIAYVDVVDAGSLRPLNAQPLAALAGSHVASVQSGALSISVVGYDSAMRSVASRQVTIIVAGEPEPQREPTSESFNHYVLESIDDWSTLPRDGTYEYCYGSSCPSAGVGMAVDAYYLGERLFEGIGTCYCSGHTLQVFLDAYQRYQEDHGLASSTRFGSLGVSDVNRGTFYQHWYGINTVPNAGSAFEAYGIGKALEVAEWENARAGDFLMLSRANRSGHAVVFMDWIREGGQIAGLRYYSCNRGGESQRDPDDPSNERGVSGPSFQSEMFVGHGGGVLPSYVFIGHAFSPEDL
jgi:hypothetical protein